MIKATCLSQSTAATQGRLQSLALADPRTAHHLSQNTSTYKQKSTINKKQYTKQYKQGKTMLQSYCICRKGHMSARIDENGVKTEKL
jgi:hypothetical protein